MAPEPGSTELNQALVLFEHDLRANTSRLSRGKPVPTFPANGDVAMANGIHHHVYSSEKRRGAAREIMLQVLDNGTYIVRCRYRRCQKEHPMANNKNPNEKQPGEKKPGKYHYNPGNMSGKTADINKDEAEQQNNVDRIRSREAPPHERS